jgi:endonuclease G
MKALVILILVTAIPKLLSAQRVQHHSYITYYKVIKGEPDSVSWDLTPNMVSCTSTTKRHDRFAADPIIADCVKPMAYTRSGYDKGHMFSYEDAHCNDTDRVECFYMSNMLPQLHALNAGDWKTLEEQERAWAKSQTIHIIAGGYGSKGRLESGVNIPESCWKAIYVDGQWHGYIMPNDSTAKGHSYSYWGGERH